MTADNGLRIEDDANKAIVIFVGKRYFAGFGARQRLQTAWSLAGARLFGVWRSDEVEKILRKIRAKGYDCGFRVVGEKAFDPEIIGRFMFGDKLKSKTEQS